MPSSMPGPNPCRIVPLSCAMALSLWLSATAAVSGDASPGARASIRGDGTLLLNDTPTFPIGIRIEGEGREHPRIAAAGFNVLLTSGEVGPAFYDAATANGLHVIAGHYLWATFNAARRDEVDLYASALKEAFRVPNVAGRTFMEALEATRPHPCVFAWNTCEEPHARVVEPLSTLYELIKSHRPHHLVVGLSDDGPSSHIFQNAADVVMVDCYPYRGRLSLPAMLIHQRVSAVRRRTGGKPVWFMPQLYPPAFFSKDPADDLSVGMLREACHLGLAAGARGIVMYSYYALGDLETDAGARRWDMVRAVVADLRRLAPLICDGRPRDLPLLWRGADGSDVPAPPTRVVEHYGAVYVLVANPTGGVVRSDVTAGLIRQHGYAFDATVFSGADGLEVATGTTDERTHPVLVVAAHGCGAFKLSRRPMWP